MPVIPLINPVLYPLVESHKNTEITAWGWGRAQEGQQREERLLKGTEHFNTGSFTLRRRDAMKSLVPLGSRVNKCPDELWPCKKTPTLNIVNRQLWGLIRTGEKG